jgi:hypothetical protein
MRKRQKSGDAWSCAQSKGLGPKCRWFLAEHELSKQLGGSLTPDEQRRIDEALQAEAERLRYAAARIVDESAKPWEAT